MIAITAAAPSSVAWTPITQGVGEFTYTVTYDRAGYGWSDESPAPRTCTVMADELWRLLQRAGVPGPYVLVGASAATTLVRVIASTHPEDVVAVVLVDPVNVPSVPLDESPLSLPQRIGVWADR